MRRKCACASVQYTDCVRLLSVPKCPMTERAPGCIKVLLFFDVQAAAGKILPHIDGDYTVKEVV